MSHFHLSYGPSPIFVFLFFFFFVPFDWRSICLSYFPSWHAALVSGSLKLGFFFFHPHILGAQFTWHRQHTKSRSTSTAIVSSQRHLGLFFCFTLVNAARRKVNYMPWIVTVKCVDTVAAVAVAASSWVPPGPRKLIIPSHDTSSSSSSPPSFQRPQVSPSSNLISKSFQPPTRLTLPDGDGAISMGDLSWLCPICTS
jgi:hypothetical protein